MRRIIICIQCTTGILSATTCLQGMMLGRDNSEWDAGLSVIGQHASFNLGKWSLIRKKTKEQANATDCAASVRRKLRTATKKK